MRRHPDHRNQIIGLATGGAVAILAGLPRSIVWPINKPLWTGSYALLMSGLASGSLALCVYVIGVRGRRRWANPFLALGVNPLAIYFGSDLVGHIIDRGAKSWLYWDTFDLASFRHHVRRALDRDRNHARPTRHSHQGLGKTVRRCRVRENT
jgi:predicted acyltransferase